MTFNIYKDKWSSQTENKDEIDVFSLYVEQNSTTIAALQYRDVSILIENVIRDMSWAYFLPLITNILRFAHFF